MPTNWFTIAVFSPLIIFFLWDMIARIKTKFERYHDPYESWGWTDTYVQETESFSRNPPWQWLEPKE